MSQENVEIISRLARSLSMDLTQLFRSDERWARWVDANGRFFNPDFRCSAKLLGEERTYSGGVNAFRAFYVGWLAPWAAYRLESTEQTIDCGDRVVVVVRDFGRPKDATREIAGRNAAVFTFRDGQAILQEAYPDPTEALKAVGLEG